MFMDVHVSRSTVGGYLKDTLDQFVLFVSSFPCCQFPIVWMEMVIYVNNNSQTIFCLKKNGWKVSLQNSYLKLEYFKFLS